MLLQAAQEQEKGLQRDIERLMAQQTAAEQNGVHLQQQVKTLEEQRSRWAHILAACFLGCCGRLASEGQDAGETVQ